MVLPFKMLMPAEFFKFLAQMYMNYLGFDNCPLMGLIVQPIVGTLNVGNSEEENLSF
jgi:hypothetical protein